MHLGGHGTLGINLHTQIYSLKFHPIINNNSGTHQVGKNGLLSTNILGWRGGHNQGNPQAPPIHMSNHPYPQFPPNTLQRLPGFVPPPLPPIPQQQPLQFQNASSPRPTLLPAQLVLNPNNKPPQPLHNVEMKAFLTYVITPVPLQEIQLRLGRVLDRQRPSSGHPGRRRRRNHQTTHG
jgi:hypothetical protein